LQNRLLNKTVHHGRDAELAFPAAGLGRDRDTARAAFALHPR
jgi:hypothetical protein